MSASAALPVLDHLNLQIEEGERVCLLGRNGAGKTTLMRIAAGESAPDTGTVTIPEEGLHRPSDAGNPESLPGTVRDIVTSGLREDDGSEDWEKDIRVDDLIARLGLPEDRAFDAFSGGLKRRCLLAKALAAKPGLLLLDEPTNHMDLDSILWMEEFLLEQKIPLLFITHDRAFLTPDGEPHASSSTAASCSSWSCDYDTYLVRKEASSAEERQRAAFDKKLAQEEAWIPHERGAPAVRNPTPAWRRLIKMRAHARGAMRTGHGLREDGDQRGRPLRRARGRGREDRLRQVPRRVPRSSATSASC
jgi:ATP-binding cassette subfamily F protein uup